MIEGHDNDDIHRDIKKHVHPYKYFKPQIW